MRPMWSIQAGQSAGAFVENVSAGRADGCSAECAITLLDQDAACSQSIHHGAIFVHGYRHQIHRKNPRPLPLEFVGTKAVVG